MMKPIRLGLLCSRIREEEKLISQAAASHKDVELVLLNSSDLVLEFDAVPNVDVVLDREISQSRALHILKWFEGSGIPTINSYDAARLGGDKVLTSKRLRASGVPTPNVKVALTRESALEAIEQMGYPVVLKPVDGSWGRLIALIENRKSAEAILEHKAHLKSYFHGIYYLQEFIDKPDRDIRAFCIGGEVIGAAYRTSEHWLTNAARGAESFHCPITPDLEKICMNAAEAVQGDAIAVDLMETPGGFTVHEVNCAMEFKSAQSVLNSNIAQALIDFCVKTARNVFERKELTVG